MGISTFPLHRATNTKRYAMSKSFHRHHHSWEPRLPARGKVGRSQIDPIYVDPMEKSPTIDKNGR